MTDVRTLGRAAWRDWNTDGLPSSGARRPPKSDIREFVDAVDLVVQTRAAFRAMTQSPEAVLVRYGLAPGDGWGGVFFRDDDDDSAEDDGALTIVNAAGKPYKRQHNPGELHFTWWGVPRDFDGTTGTNARSELLAALAASASLRLPLRIQGGYYLTGGHIDLSTPAYAGAVVDGGLNPGEVLPDGNWGPPGDSVHRFDFTRTGSGFFLDPTYTIKPGNRCKFSGLFIVTPATSKPANNATEALATVSAFTGTAFDVKGSDVVLDSLVIYGFNKAAVSNGYERSTFSRILADCTNPVDVSGSSDRAITDTCLFGPYYSTGHNTNLSGDQLVRRAGVGIHYHDTVDGGMLVNTITYGYDIGLHLNGGSTNVFDVHVNGCSFDNNITNSATSGSVGVKTSGAVIQAKINGAHVDSCDTSYDWGHSGDNASVMASDLSSGQAVTTYWKARANSSGIVSGFQAGGSCVNSMVWDSGISKWLMGSIILANSQPSGSTFSFAAADINARNLLVGLVSIKAGTATDNLGIALPAGRVTGVLTHQNGGDHTISRFRQLDSGNFNCDVLWGDEGGDIWLTTVRCNGDDDFWFYNLARGVADLSIDATTGQVNLGTGLSVGGVAVVGSRKTGWAAATGTATRTTFATGSVTLPQLAERVKALIDDLSAHGLIGS